MIRKFSGFVQLVCDSCGAETPDFDEDEFEALLNAAKSDGWSITRPEGHWRHDCDSCASEPGNALAAAKRKFGIH